MFYSWQQTWINSLQRINLANDHKTLASVRSFSISSFTSFTIIPGGRFGGSETEIVSTLGSMSIPSELTSIVSTFFFLAFIVLDKDVNLGLFKRRSHVITAGNRNSTVSSPPSTSRVTLTTLVDALSSSTWLAKVP